MRTFVILLFTISLANFAQDAEIWCVGDSFKIKADQPPEKSNLVWNGATKTVQLGAARNEYTAFQIAISAGQNALAGVTVVPADLKGPNNAVIPVSSIELFVEHYLNVTVTSRGSETEIFKHATSGEHPAQMVPFEAKEYGAPFAVFAQRNQPVWVDIYVPDNAAPGDYTGTFQVKAGNLTLGEVKVSLNVWNFTLPHETHFHSFLYTGPENLRWAHRLSHDMETAAFKTVEDRYFQMAHQHRLNFHPSGGGVLQEIGQRYAKYYDGRGFTERAGRGVGQNTINMPAEGKSEEDFKSNAKKIVELCEQKKYNALIFSYVWDEPHSAEDFAKSKERCKWIHDAVGKKLKTFIATPQWQKYDAGDVDLFSETNVPDIAKVIARGDSVWAVNAGYAAGPYLDSPGYGGRSIAWMNWRMNLGGWQFWDCCYWIDRQNRKHRDGKKWVADFTFKEINENPALYMTDLWRDPLNFDESRKKGYPMRDSIRINGDGLLFYPGHDIGIHGPIASFAMKSLRRGAQDYEYLWLAKAAGKSAEADAIAKSVCPEPGKWNEDPESWEIARLKLAALLSKQDALMTKFKRAQ